MFVSIRYKLGLSLFLSVFVLTLLIVSIQQYHSYIRFRDHVRHSTALTIRVAIDLADNWIREKMNIAQVLAYGVEKTKLARSDTKKALERMAKENKIASAYAGFENGEFVDTSGWKPREGFEFKERPWYGMAKSRGSPVYVAPYVDAMTGQYTVTFAAPVYDRNGLLVQGVVAYDVLFKELNELVSSLFESEVKELIPFRLTDGRVGVLVKNKEVSDYMADELISWINEGGLDQNAVRRIGDDKYLLVHDELETARTIMVYPISLTQLMEPLLIQSIVYFGVTAVGLWFIVNIAWAILGRYIRRIEGLSKSSRTVSEGNFDIEVKKSSNDELGQLAESFNTMVQAIKRYMRLQETTIREKEAVTQELKIAAELQKKALPLEMPKISGAQIAAKSFPAKEVGGDYYDFIIPREHHLGIVIADAAGKGFPGSLYMSNSRSVFRVIATNETSPSRMLTKTNDCIVNDSTQEGMFITYIFGVYDDRAKRFTFANGGHFPPLYYKASEASFRPLESRGIPLGIMKDQEYAEETVDLSSGDVLVLYTDGFIDASDARGETFGVERLQSAVQKNAYLPAEEIIDRIQDSVAGFVGNQPQYDDMTMVVLKAE